MEKCLLEPTFHRFQEHGAENVCDLDQSDREKFVADLALLPIKARKLSAALAEVRVFLPS